jgi:hypothetical protein
MNDQPTATLVGDPVDAPVSAPPKTRDERIEDWKKENLEAYKAAREACCVCSPTRAQTLLVQQFTGVENPPID